MTLFWTSAIAFFLFLAAVLLISISLLLTGRNRVRGGSCGRFPANKRDDECGKDQSCDLCSPKKETDNDDIHQKQP